MLLLIMEKGTIHPNSATRSPERSLLSRLRGSTSDFSGLDLEAFKSVTGTLRIPAATTALVLAVATAYRLLTQDPTPTRQANDLSQATGLSDEFIECRQISYILPDPRCEKPVLLPTPTAEQWDKMIRIQEENKDKSPFTYVEK